ncbi:hypothetical protein BRCON_2165 [Candidatus Sumerlaea chitinivorans]|uniref:Uncharacterized protein n=1 Tax=Sumerlaea chitinivorans TaxID=2250252 RepID=A0A2Z4Y8F5_SUMC1|nr:hypothetical protein BRCON_2165 [Candidatus Sumerlaea chitinivorans]
MDLLPFRNLRMLTEFDLSRGETTLFAEHRVRTQLAFRPKNA